MPCTVVVCGFFGDTGKGKIISYLSLKDKTAVAASSSSLTNLFVILMEKVLRRYLGSFTES